MGFLFWTSIYLLTGFAFSYFTVKNIQKFHRKRGSFRNDDPWHILAVAIMLLWLPIAIFMILGYCYGYLVGFLYEMLKFEIFGADKYLQKKRGYAREISSHEAISKNVNDVLKWHEAEISKCEYGCKIYEHEKTGVRVLAHNSAYGCKK